MVIEMSEGKPVPLPSAKPVQVAPHVILQPPLSRWGKGPPLLIVLPSDYNGFKPSDNKSSLDPEPLQKWAEEGFAVVEVKVGSDFQTFVDGCEKGVAALKALQECTFDSKLAVIVYEFDRNFNSHNMRLLWRSIWQIPELVATVSFSSQIMGESHSGQLKNEAPLMIHRAGNIISDLCRTTDVVHVYENARSTNFILPSHEDFQVAAAGVAHTRSLNFLRKHLGGPIFDLEAIWEEHTLFEFGERNVEKTMGTMVQEPYVNHVPTMTGGVGRSALSNFYQNHFIFNNPEDTALELVSRTVGVDRVIDEFIFSFTHDKVIDWLIPGIPPTGKHVRIPFTSVVNVRGDRLYNEHIAWDQATVLRQLGLLPDYLPFPYPLPDGRTPAKGKRFEYRVPTAGVETAMKLEDPSSVDSNDMLQFEIREVDDV
ncbi:hypothetical protein D0Z07_9068 [Hyphodiscus hymeniophilus]|uniref:Carboxymethylenebutenolidase n=1 Tax=Hyphodiscus hymeniophilus TaxID=353542 RepID=A0A9P6SPZ5_9HELO|nr:hypothetical protein D0Z07_9068 [Hyphodiscus hymeniophilus]